MGEMQDQGESDWRAASADDGYTNWRYQGQAPAIRPRHELVPRHVRDAEITLAWTKDTRILYASELRKTAGECLADASEHAGRLVQKDPGIAPGLRAFEADFIDGARYILREYMTGRSIY